MNIVREAFEAARLDAGEIDAALDAAEAYLAARPGHPVAQAYQGGLHAMKAGASPLPWVKLKHANLAASLLDDAHDRRADVEAQGAEDYPADLEILLLRGVAYANFPAFLGRAETARACLEAARDHPAFPTVPTLYRALAYAHLAVLGHRRGADDAARGHLECAQAADPVTAERIWAAR